MKQVAVDLVTSGGGHCDHAMSGALQQRALVSGPRSPVCKE